MALSAPGIASAHEHRDRGHGDRGSLVYLPGTGDTYHRGAYGCADRYAPGIPTHELLHNLDAGHYETCCTNDIMYQPREGSGEPEPTANSQQSGDQRNFDRVRLRSGDRPVSNDRPDGQRLGRSSVSSQRDGKLSGVHIVRAVLSVLLAGMMLAAQASPASAGGGGRNVPPRASIRSTYGVQATGASTYCWPYRNGPARCADSFQLVADQGYLPVDGASRISIRIAGGGAPPRRLFLGVNEPLPDDFDPNRQASGPAVAQEELPPARTAVWDVDLAPGRYVLSVSAYWKRHRDARWVFGIEVEGGSLPRTGARLGVLGLMGLGVLSLGLAAARSARSRTLRAPFTRRPVP